MFTEIRLKLIRISEYDRRAYCVCFYMRQLISVMEALYEMFEFDSFVRNAFLLHLNLCDEVREFC